MLLGMSQRRNTALYGQVPTNLQRFLTTVRTDMYMRILSGSVIAVQSHHLSYADVIAFVNSYVIEMRKYHDHSIRSLELDITRRRLSRTPWSVSYAI